MRFKGFKEPWVFYKAEEIFNSITDKKHPTETVLTIIQGKGTLPREKAGRNIHYDNASLSGYKKVQKGDYIIHLRSFEGGLEMANEDGIVSPAYTILRCNKPHSSLFYDSYFHTDEFINHILSKSVEGIRDGRQISYDAFKWLHVPYCSPAEQEKIAQLFHIMNCRIEKQLQLVNALKKYKRGLLSTVFSNVTNFVYLKDISEYVSSSKTMSYINSLPKGSYPVYDASGIASFVDYYDMANDYICIIKDGSGVGRLQFCQAKSSFIGTLGGLIPKSCSAFFLYTVLQTIDFKDYVTGMAIPHIYYKDYKETKIPYPCNKERAKIQDIFQKVDCKITNEEILLNKICELKKSLLQQLFI